jgi:DNA-directed RNA polymerase specialized sigma24 family protein
VTARSPRTWVQETFLRAWRVLGGLRAEDSPNAWLLTILRNEHARRVEPPSG